PARAHGLIGPSLAAPKAEGGAGHPYPQQVNMADVAQSSGPPATAKPRSETARAAAAPPPSRPITVLLGDDQVIVGESLRRMLAPEADIIFHHCADPSQAIHMAKAIEPTVILQDLVMPDIDGLQLVKFFRANKSTRDTPMIVLSSKEEPVIKAQAFALGA